MKKNLYAEALCFSPISLKMPPNGVHLSLIVLSPSLSSTVLLSNALHWVSLSST